MQKKIVTVLRGIVTIADSGESMNRKYTKAMICAVATALFISGSNFQTDAAVKVSAMLPAAGIGLMLGEGTSVAEVRKEVQKKAETKAAEQSTQAAGETVESAQSAASAEGPAETETVWATEAVEPVEVKATEIQTEVQNTESTRETEIASNDAQEGTKQETEVAETEIVEAIEPQLQETEEETAGEPEQQEEILIIAQVNDYVNIRSIPSTDGEIVGKLYDNSVGTLISEEDGWYLMKSGSVEGYVKAEYFKTGDEAKRIADEVGNKIATVTTETLRVRSEASLEASVLGLVPGGEVLTVLAQENGFVKVSIEEGDGWVSTDYVDVEVEYVTAESVAEERARLEKEEKAKEEARKAAEAAEAKLKAEAKKREEEAAKKAAEAAQQAETAQAQAAQAASEAQNAAQETVAAPAPASSLGQAVANYAVQFVGNPYVYGGISLTNGADCSGFVMSVYKNFGVSLPHSSSADRNVGYAVDGLANAQPGDIVCYSGHVGIYIGNGQIVHASTEKTGIKISNASYRKVLAVRRIF